MTSNHIWLRAETKPNEQRRALTPEKCRLLVEKGKPEPIGLSYLYCISHTRRNKQANAIRTFPLTVNTLHRHNRLGSFRATSCRRHKRNKRGRRGGGGGGRGVGGALVTSP